MTTGLPRRPRSEGTRRPLWRSSRRSVPSVDHDHPAEPSETHQRGKGGRRQQRALRAARDSARGEQPLQQEDEYDHADGRAGRLLHPVNGVGGALTWCHREQVARFGRDERAGELRAERRGERAHDREPGRARGRKALGEAEHQRCERRDPQPLEQEPERPGSARVRPLEIGRQEQERRRGERCGGPAPAGPLDDDHRRHGERPGERESAAIRVRARRRELRAALSRGRRERPPARPAPGRGSGLCSRPRPAH